jgi:hypothetical protein
MNETMIDADCIDTPDMAWNISIVEAERYKDSRIILEAAFTHSI